MASATKPATLLHQKPLVGEEMVKVKKADKVQKGGKSPKKGKSPKRGRYKKGGEGIRKG